MNIENKKQFATILLAVGLGLAAAGLIGKVVNDKVQEQTTKLSNENNKRNAAMVKEIEGLKQNVGAIHRKNQELEQKLAQRPTVVAQATVSAKPEVKQPTGFALRTPSGKRAFTMKINSLSAVGGLIGPGDFIDLIAHLNIPKGGGSTDTVTTFLFQNILVLAVGTNFNPDTLSPYGAQQSTGALIVTLALEPEEAGLLSFVQNKGDFQMSLRSPRERENKLLHQVASWDALAEYVLEQQGTILKVLGKEKLKESKKEPVKATEPQPKKAPLQIFESGRQL